MGIPSEAKNYWANKITNNHNNNNNTNSFVIPSSVEDQKISNSRRCTQEGVRAGAKAAAIAFVVSAVPTLTAVRVIPWVQANINYTGQALIISAASIASYFVTVDKTILECARRIAQYDKTVGGFK